MNSNNRQQTIGFGQSFRGIKVDTVYDHLQKPKEVVKLVQIQYHPKQLYVNIPNSGSRQLVSLSGKPIQSPNRSKSMSKRNTLASPEAKRPTINCPQSDNKSNPLGMEPISQSAFLQSVTPLDNINELQRKPYSSHSNVQIFPPKTALDSSTVTRTSNVTSFSNNPLCSNNDGKRAKYSIKGINQQQVFCPKCAIVLVEQGVKIEQIETGVAQPLHTQDRQKQLTDALDSLENLGLQFITAIDHVGDRKQSVNNILQQQQVYLKNAYTSLRKTVDQSEQLDFDRLITCRNSIITIIENREAELLMSFEKLKSLKNEILAMRQIPTLANMNDNDYLIRKQNFEKNIKRLEICINQDQQSPQKEMPRLRDMPLWEGGFLTFLEFNKPLCVEFSFNGKPPQVVPMAQLPIIIDQQRTITD